MMDTECPHTRIRISNYPYAYHCDDCGIELPDPLGCFHSKIDNVTQRCCVCGEKMLSQHREIVTVRDAPNAAACTNPECSGYVDDPNCGNPHSLYVPDRSREREVPVRMTVTYKCERCHMDGSIEFRNNQVVWPCSNDHRGDSIPLSDWEGF